MSRRLTVLLKAPVPGQCKTRLIPDYSAADAAELYRCLAFDTLQTVSRVAGAVIEAAYAAHPRATNLAWLGVRESVPCFEQRGKSAGERLQNAFERGFKTGASSVVVIEGETPLIDKSLVQQAFSLLDECDVVLGPTENGGCYLVGLSRPPGALWADVHWPTDRLYEETLGAAARTGWRVRALPALYDVDDLPALERLARDLRSAPGETAPATRRFLQKKGRA